MEFVLQALNHSYLNVLVLLVSMSSGLANLFAYCYFGNDATDYFLTFGDLLYDTKWIDMPNDLKMFLTMMMRNAQVPLHYHGMGIVYTNLQTFSNVSGRLKL